MPGLIDPKGAFYGERLARCSDKAQLYWMRFYVASNTFARLELSYENLLTGPLHNLKKPPSRTEVKELLIEYRDNWLLFIYQSNGSIWGQFITNMLPSYKLKADMLTPVPPEAEFAAYVDAYADYKAVLNSRDYLEELLGTFPKTKVSETFQKISNSSEGVETVLENSHDMKRGELSRDEVSREINTKANTLASSDKSLSAESAPVFLTLPLNNKSEHPILEATVAELKPLYPAVDVEQKLREMRAWLISNPTKRKTKTGVMRFVNAWLSREQDKFHPTGEQNAQQRPRPSGIQERAERILRNTLATSAALSGVPNGNAGNHPVHADALVRRTGEPSTVRRGSGDAPVLDHEDS